MTDKIDLCTIPERRVASLLACGLEQGAGYWARIDGYEEPPEWRKRPVLDVGCSEPPEIYRHTDYPLTGGSVFLIRPDEPKAERLCLDGAAIERGLKLMRDTPVGVKHWADLVRETYDATTGDVFLQLCLLGELVYG